MQWLFEVELRALLVLQLKWLFKLCAFLAMNCIIKNFVTPISQIKIKKKLSPFKSSKQIIRKVVGYTAVSAT